MSILQLKTTVLSGGRIVIESTGLPEGQEVTLKIVLDEHRAAAQSNGTTESGRTETLIEKKSFLENLGDYRGGALFKTAEEVDQYIQEERDSWGN